MHHWPFGNGLTTMSSPHYQAECELQKRSLLYVGEEPQIWKSFKHFPSRLRSSSLDSGFFSFHPICALSVVYTCFTPQMAWLGLYLDFFLTTLYRGCRNRTHASRVAPSQGTQDSLTSELPRPRIGSLSLGRVGIYLIFSRTSHRLVETFDESFMDFY